MKKILLLAGMLLFPVAVRAADDVRLTTPVSGVVTAVFVEAGQAVRKGDKLVALDDVRYRARLMEAEGGRMGAQQEAEDAEKEVRRAEELYARGVSSTNELDAARLRQARARASLKQAEARYLLAQKDLDDTVLRAPFDGVVKSTESAPGMYVPAELSPPVLIILNRSR
jgi:RND family efflux transporter MFP subunit